MDWNGLERIAAETACCLICLASDRVTDNHVHCQEAVKTSSRGAKNVSHMLLIWCDILGV